MLYISDAIATTNATASACASQLFFFVIVVIIICINNVFTELLSVQASEVLLTNILAFSGQWRYVDIV